MKKTKKSKINVLVVGGAGYIGGAVTDILMERNIPFTVYDNLLYEHQYFKLVNFVYGDIRDTKKLKKLLPYYTHVIWLAAIVGDAACQIRPELTIEINQKSIQWLSKNYDGRIILIISSDLSHFHSKKKAFELDKIVVDRINNMEFPELYNDLANNNCEACGGGGIVALLECADIIGDYKAEVLSHTDSGDVSNDNSSVVGYLSAVIYSN